MIVYDNLTESLKTQRQKYLGDFGEENIIGHTNLVEISLISLYNRIANVLNVNAEAFRATGALVALGDLGKSFIGPYQTISILFLMTRECRLQDEWLKEIVDPIKEAGWKITYQTGTVEEILEKVSSDTGLLGSLMSLRYISGNRNLVEELEHALEQWLDTHSRDLEAQLCEEWATRMLLLNNARNWMEPDIVHFPGGLGDARSIRTALKLSGFQKIDEAVKKGVLEPQDGESVLKAERFYVRIINAILSEQPNNGTILTFRMQESVSRSFGYPPKGPFSGVEVFMQGVYRSFFKISRIAKFFWEDFLTSSEAGGEAYNVEEGITVSQGRLYVDFNRVNISPELFVRIFRLAAQYGVRISVQSLRKLRDFSHILETSSGNRNVLEELLQTIHADSPELPVFRQFHDMEFLGCLIPEWNGIIGLTQYDNFHEYPFNEHALRTLEEVKKVLAGFYRTEEPVLTAVARRINDPRWLYLGALLHDIGKSAGRDHAIKGGEMIPAIARRLGMLPEESDMVQFLVGQHTLIMDSASMRDVGDEEMLAHCSLTVGDPVRLDYLLVLTFADLKTTGEKGFRKWQQIPIIFLYERLSQILEKGEPRPSLIAERIEQIKKIIQKEVSDLMDEFEVRAQLEGVGPRYLLSMEPQDIARHLRMEWELLHSPESFIFDVRHQDWSWIVTIVSEAAPWLLFKTAGLLTLHSISISAAQVFVKRNGIVILIFHCAPADPSIVPDWESLKKDLKRLIEHKLSLDFRLSQKITLMKSSSETFPELDTKIVIDNESSAHYSILEVHTRNRSGLLYLITKTLADLGIRVYVAKITTRGNRVADVFYIKDHLDRKLEDPEQIEELRSALLYWLDKTNLAEGNS